MSRLGLHSRKLGEGFLTASHIRLRFKLIHIEPLDMMDMLSAELCEKISI